MSDTTLYGTIGLFAAALIALPLGAAFVVSHLGWKISGLAVVGLLAFTKLGSSLAGLLLVAGYIAGVRRSGRRRYSQP